MSSNEENILHYFLPTFDVKFLKLWYVEIVQIRFLSNAETQWLISFMQMFSISVKIFTGFFIFIKKVWKFRLLKQTLKLANRYCWIGLLDLRLKFIWVGLDWDWIGNPFKKVVWISIGNHIFETRLAVKNFPRCFEKSKLNICT